MTALPRLWSIALATSFTLAGCGPKPALAAPLMPLSDVVEEHVCYLKEHLYERDGIFFCTGAASPARWPKRPTYAMLGTDVARFEPEIAAVMKETHTITVAEMVCGDRPDLIVEHGRHRGANARAQSVRQEAWSLQKEVHSLLLTAVKSGDSRTSVAMLVSMCRPAIESIGPLIARHGDKSAGRSSSRPQSLSECIVGFKAGPTA